jgi:hypothetical protein
VLHSLLRASQAQERPDIVTGSCISDSQVLVEVLELQLSGLFICRMLTMSLANMHVLMRRCGITFDDAGKSCGSLCPTGEDAECPKGEACFADVVCATTDGSESANRCGTTYIAARTTCGALCPGAKDAECPSGQACFAAIVCTAGVPATPSPSTIVEDPPKKPDDKGPPLNMVETIVSILAGIVGIGGGIAATICWCKKHHHCGS